MEDLIEHAAALGLRVKWRPLGRRTAELHSSGLILVNPNRTMPMQRMAIAHECGHWAHGHDWTRTHDRERDERQADTYAARLLITPEAYRDAEEIAGAHLGALARELNVRVDLVRLWQDSYRAEVGVVRHPNLRVVGGDW